MASTGSNLEAEIAGIIPDINPITPAKPAPNNILLKLKINSKSKIFVISTAIPQTIKSPMMPPMTESITASNKN